MISESYAERIRKYIQEAERNSDILNTQKILPADYRAMGTAAQLFTESMLIGLDSALQKKQFAEIDIEDIENLPYEEAVEYLSKRSVLKKADYYKLSDKLRFRAFTVGRINDGRLLEKLNSEMIKNVNDGKGLKDFLSLTKTDILNKIGMGPNQGWYWETVYRTNVQTAYNVGRAMGFEEDHPIALEFVGIDDARQTETCSSLSGTIRPYDDPFWETHTPPMHFNCRSTLRGIYDEAELPGKWSPVADAEEAAKGFGSWPTENNSWWEELASQTKAAKYYGVQGEIEAAREILIKNLESKTEKKEVVLGINLFDESTSIYTDAFRIEEEEGFVDVYIHGSSTNVQAVIDGKIKNLDVNQFVKYLKEKGYKGGDIRLAACSAGYGDDSFAQRLSKKLGVKVKASPLDVYFIPEDGILRIGSPYTNLADWRLFDNGVEVK
ncbi:MAG: minor capsid protein [Treponema sp.]|nr:minor capsid protein [Treponema sp.]